MRFYKLEDVVTRNDDRVFKASPTRKFIPFFIFSAIALTALVLAIRGGVGQGSHARELHLSPGFLYFLAVVFGLIGYWAFTIFRASLKPSNWLLRCNESGIIINYRTYLNWRFPHDTMQAVGFDYSEIAWARTVKERRTAPDMEQKGSQTSTLTFLDFCLAKDDTVALEAQLKAERNLRPDGMVTSCDYPVNVLPGGMIEVQWNGIHPAVGQAIQYLGQHLQIATPESRKVDLTHDRKLNPEQERGKIVALLKSGDELGAAKLAQQVYGYSTTEAMNFLEKLQAES